MRNFSHHSREHPTLGREIIALNGLSAENEPFWMAWKDAVLDIACDASDQSHLLTLIKKAVPAFSGALEGPRAVLILADLSKIVPNTMDLIIKNFDTAFPYWKNPQSSEQIHNFTKNALEFSAHVHQLQERIIDFLTRKILVIDLSIRLDDVPLIMLCDNESPQLINHNDAKVTDSSNNLIGAGEKYAQEEKARELEEAQVAQQFHSKQVRDYADKIDLMLLVILEFINQNCIDKRRELALYILISFEKHVLPAIKPKFTQILIFYCASVDNFIADRLLGIFIAALFSRDIQLSPSAPRNSSNNQIKAKTIRSIATFLKSFMKTATSLTDQQFQTVIDLLMDWISRKVDALTLFSCNHIEISILAAVLEALFDIFINHPEFAIKSDANLIEAVKLTANILPDSLKSQKIVADYLQLCGPLETASNPIQPKLPYTPFEYIVLPKTRKFLLDSQILQLKPK